MSVSFETSSSLRIRKRLSPGSESLRLQTVGKERYIDIEIQRDVEMKRYDRRTPPSRKTSQDRSALVLPAVREKERVGVESASGEVKLLE